MIGALILWLYARSRRCGSLDFARDRPLRRRTSRARAACARSIVRQRRRALIGLGAGAAGRRRRRWPTLLVGKLAAHPEYRLEVIGVARHARAEHDTEQSELPVLGTLDELDAVAAQHGVSARDRLAARDIEERRARGAARGAAARWRSRSRVLPDALRRPRPRGRGRRRRGRDRARHQPAVAAAVLARCSSGRMDLAIAAVLLIVLCAAAACSSRSRSSSTRRGPVFFRQERVGPGGRRFRLFKFRTMVVDAEQQRAALLEHSDRPELAEARPRPADHARWGASCAA